MKFDTTTSNIIKRLNEGIEDPELTVGVDQPKVIMQCADCGKFYIEDERKIDESVCPKCESENVEVVDEDDEIEECSRRVRESIESEATIEEEDSEGEDEVIEEAEELADDALETLDNGDYAKFSECYSPRVRMTKGGLLEAVVKVGNTCKVAKRRMSARQKAAYRLAENYKPATAKSSRSSLTSDAKVSRSTLLALREARAVKRLVMKQVAAKGIDTKKLGEAIDSLILNRKSALVKAFEGVDQSEVKSEITPSEIKEEVDTIVSDAGLEVVSSEVSREGQTAVVHCISEDTDATEIRTSEVADVISDALDAPVEVTEPIQSEIDPNLVEFDVVVNPDDELTELDVTDDDAQDITEEDEVTSELQEKLRRRRARRLREELSELEEDDDIEGLEEEDEVASEIQERLRRRKAKRLREELSELEEEDDINLEEEDEVTSEIQERLRRHRARRLKEELSELEEEDDIDLEEEDEIASEIKEQIRRRRAKRLREELSELEEEDDIDLEEEVEDEPPAVGESYRKSQKVRRKRSRR